MDSVHLLIMAYVISLGAMMSPGPDFLIVMRNALGYSARTGVFTAAGIAAGLVFHMTYCLAGIALLISSSIMLFNIFKWIGAAYLIYVGIGALRSKGTVLTGELKKADGKTARQAFMNGLITNLFNPKATMFFLALFSQVIDPATPFVYQFIFCAVSVVTAFIWFSVVAVVMGVAPVRQAYARAAKWVDRVFGGFFIALGAKLALARLS